jgi:hypothetical protein
MEIGGNKRITTALCHTREALIHWLSRYINTINPHTHPCIRFSEKHRRQIALCWCVKTWTFVVPGIILLTYVICLLSCGMNVSLNKALIRMRRKHVHTAASYIPYLGLVNLDYIHACQQVAPPSSFPRTHGIWRGVNITQMCLYIYCIYSVSTKSTRGFEKLWRANKLS